MASLTSFFERYFTPAVKKRLRTYAALATVVVVALHILHPYNIPWLVEQEDAAMDSVMRLFRNLSIGRHRDAFILVEADQDAYEEWNQPFYFDRTRVAGLINAVALGKPRMIIVDVDLSTGDKDAVTCDDKDGRENPEPCYAESTKALKSTIREYGAENPPLILVRTLAPLSQEDPGSGLLPQRRSFLDDEVWASPHFQRDSDYRIRRWHLWMPTCTDGVVSVLPSVQLLAQRLLADVPGTYKQKYESLIDKQLTPIAAEKFASEVNRCSRRDETVPFDAVDSIKTTVEIAGGYMIDLEAENLVLQRLIYRIPYDPEEFARPRIDIDGRSVPVFDSVSARHFFNGADLDLQERVDSKFFEDRIVIIGGTFQETRDWHITPAGEMPGAMVIVNAIDSLGNHGQLHSPGVLTKILLAILSVLFISIFFAYFESLFAKVVVLVLVMVVAQPIAYKLFPTGVWLNVALPAMVMGLTELVLDIRELRNPLKDDVGNTDAGDNTHRSFSFLRIIKIGRRRG
jgi:CHASE2 domain-containing sensor protein